MFGDDVDDPQPIADDPVRLLICDQHDLVRRSLTASLEEGDALEVVAEAADGAEAVAEARHTAPDVAFVSLLLPELSGRATIGLIAELMPGIELVALAVEEPVEERFDALAAGACGVMDKEDVLGATATAVERVLRHQPAIDDELAAALLERFDDLVGPARALRDRERAVLECLAAGQEDATIAPRLELPEGEVHNHVVNVLGRLHAAAPPDPCPRSRAVLEAVGC